MTGKLEKMAESGVDVGFGLVRDAVLGAAERVRNKQEYDRLKSELRVVGVWSRVATESGARPSAPSDQGVKLMNGDPTPYGSVRPSARARVVLGGVEYHAYSRTRVCPGGAYDRSARIIELCVEPVELAEDSALTGFVIAEWDIHGGPKVPDAITAVQDPANRNQMLASYVSTVQSVVAGINAASDMQSHNETAA